MSNRRKVLIGLGAGTALVAWRKPVVNQVVLPAHAQTSVVCPMAMVGNVLFSPVSGVPANEPERCSVEFEILSGDAAVDLNIISITNSTLSEFTSVDYAGFGTATSTTGPRVTWRGEATDAPFCNTVSPINDVTFTITASCEGGDEFSQDITLQEVVAT